MELEIIEPSAWATVSAILSLLGVFAGIIVIAISFVLMLVEGKPKMATAVFIAGAILGAGSLFSSDSIKDAHTAQQEASFSQQLEEEYDATSSRSLEDMRKDFYKYNEAATVLTRDGEVTTVFVKKIGDDDKKLTMVFTVLDETSLYPKTTK